MAVYKDKKRGTWYVSLYYTDWTGKQQRKLKRGFSTKKEAQDWERHFSLEKASSLDMTFGDFYKRYTDDVKPKLRENTWKSKEYVIELKILPYFKDMVMREITPRDVIAWQNEMRKCESQDGEKYKGTYLRKMQAELSAIFNHAEKYYELPKNPAVIAGPLGQHHADEMLFWTKEEYMRFIPEVANKTYSYMAFELLYWCGIRIGEMMALTPADFDFDKNKLSITKSYQAALFAFDNPLNKGVLLADEVGLGKTIEAGIILSQLWNEGKTRMLIVAPLLLLLLLLDALLLLLLLLLPLLDDVLLLARK